MSSLGVTEFLSIITDEISQGHLTYRFPVTEDGLLSFSKECLGLNVLLVPDDESFAILCTADDYYVVAGPYSFVSSAVGGDIAAAREAFFFFASDAVWPDDVRSFLMNIALTYSSF